LLPIFHLVFLVLFSYQPFEGNGGIEFISTFKIGFGEMFF